MNAAQLEFTCLAALGTPGSAAGTLFEVAEVAP